VVSICIQQFSTLTLHMHCALQCSCVRRASPQPELKLFLWTCTVIYPFCAGQRNAKDGFVFHPPDSQQQQEDGHHCASDHPIKDEPQMETRSLQQKQQHQHQQHQQPNHLCTMSNATSSLMNTFPGYKCRRGLFADQAVQLLQEFYVCGNPAGACMSSMRNGLP